MNAKTREAFFIAFLVLTGEMAGASSTTQPAAHDPLARLVASVSEKAADRSVVLVLRPDASLSIESPSAVAGIRDAVIHSLSDGKVNITASDAADAVVRDSASAGPITVAKTDVVLTAAKADLLLCGVVSRGNANHRIAFTLSDAHHTLEHLSVVMKAADLPATGDDIELATRSISADVKAALARCADAAQAGGVKTLLLQLQSDNGGNAGNAGFEMALYDSVVQSLRENQLEIQPLSEPLRAGVVTPSVVANLKETPPDSAVAVVSYARRPGGTVVKISVVSAKAQLAAASAGIDLWDEAVFPQLPILNSRVLAYSEAQQGKKVGNGECWTLAAEALKDAKAKQANGYTFGRKLAAGDPILPGDIFQFTSAKFEGKSGNGTWWVTLGMPNHTAVVRRVLGPGKFEILEQNPGPVKAATIDFKDLVSGKWEAWRPESK